MAKLAKPTEENETRRVTQYESLFINRPEPNFITQVKFFSSSF